MSITFRIVWFSDFCKSLCEPEAIKKACRNLACCCVSRGLFLGGLDVFSFCVKLGEFSGPVTYCDLSAWIVMTPDPRLDVMVSMVIRWDLSTSQNPDPRRLVCQTIFCDPQIPQYSAALKNSFPASQLRLEANRGVQLFVKMFRRKIPVVLRAQILSCSARKYLSRACQHLYAPTQTSSET